MARSEHSRRYTKLPVPLYTQTTNFSIIFQRPKLVRSKKIPMTKGKPLGYLTFTLHAHLPYVVNHGSWPHGLEWLLEAAAETYLPFLRVLRRLESDGIALKANVNLSPILLEQLAHPVFKTEFPAYLKRKIAAAKVDEEQFTAAGDAHMAETALWWVSRFTETLAEFQAFDQDILRGFRHFNDTGMIEIITCAASHGYLPLLGTDESVIAQIKTGAASHRKHLGKAPRGFWAPECGYRPGGTWQMPVAPEGAVLPVPAFQRIGVEEAIFQGGLKYFFVDTHQVDATVKSTAYDVILGEESAAEELEIIQHLSSVYKPYVVKGQTVHQHPVSVFPRDPRTGLQVWSGETGYPGDGVYLDFHKKRWPGGHRYWQVTHSKADLGLKTPYYPKRAAARAKAHAEHFVSVVIDTLRPSFGGDRAPVLTAPFDAELFGHWWHEGPEFLEHVARAIAREDCPVELIRCSEYLDQYPSQELIELPEGSWGQYGKNHVWLNTETQWTWAEIYRAELIVRTIVTEEGWRDSGTRERILRQLCRELLLMESSDWQFLITTGPARDYGEARFKAHASQFKSLEKIWLECKEIGELSADAESTLKAIEDRDNIFAEIDPSNWKMLADSNS
jgi:1,4-alpha-glucan branching enzyme